MSKGVVVAIISGVMALLGVIISQSFELIKRRSEEKRWYADYFLPKKFDSISALYAQLQTSYGITIYKSRRLKDDGEFQQLVVEPVNSFTHKYHMASIYLPEEVNKSLEKFRNSLFEASLHIRSLIEPISMVHEGIEKNVVVEWPDDIESSYADAKNKLGAKLTPLFLEKVEKDF